MTLNELYDHGWRNWAGIMREFKLGQNTYQRWLRIGYIPYPTQLKIERMTKGKLKANNDEQFHIENQKKA